MKLINYRSYAHYGRVHSWFKRAPNLQGNIYTGVKKDMADQHITGCPKGMIPGFYSS